MGSDLISSSLYGYDLYGLLVVEELFFINQKQLPMYKLICFPNFDQINMETVDQMPTSMEFTTMYDLCDELREWLPDEQIWIFDSKVSVYRLITVYDNGSYETHKNQKHKPRKRLPYTSPHYIPARYKPDYVVTKEYSFNLQYSNVCGYAFGVNEGFKDIPTDNRMLCEAITLRERARTMGKSDHVAHLNLVVGFLANYVTVEN